MPPPLNSGRDLFSTLTNEHPGSRSGPRSSRPSAQPPCLGRVQGALVLGLASARLCGLASRLDGLVSDRAGVQGEPLGHPGRQAALQDLHPDARNTAKAAWIEGEEREGSLRRDGVCRGFTSHLLTPEVRGAGCFLYGIYLLYN